jgi:hypothetical protein
VPRLWTVDEANAELPRIESVVAKARATGGNGHGSAETLIQQAASELAADGIVLRDPDRGLIDFYAETDDGRAYWLCWVVGEAEVAWWHWPEDGFAGRRPLDDPPR